MASKIPERNSGPLRDYVKSFKIVMIIIDKDDKELRVERLDYGEYEDKKFLGRLSYWAWVNGHTVETMSAEAYEAVK